MLWIVNFLSYRIDAVNQLLTADDQSGTIFGLLLVVIFTYILSFSLILLFFRGRDCSDHRKSAFHFFVFSVITYLILTFPPVYEIGIFIS